MDKPRVVFPFVEAGFGHIMPLTAIANAFERKYGDQCEVVRTNFYTDTNDEHMKAIEDDIIYMVKRHNKHKIHGILQFAMMLLAGQRNSLNYVFKARYKKGYDACIANIERLKPDVIVSTHFSTQYYACEYNALNHKNIDVISYCPDPVVGRQWDVRTNLQALSAEKGKTRAIKQMKFRPEQLFVCPFMIRQEIKDIHLSKEQYREELGLPKNKFTVLLCDGAYGAGKLRKTYYALLKTNLNISVVVVCGKNEPLYNELSALKPKPNMDVKVFGFTREMLKIAAASDLFVGKSGASNLAEACYFSVPQIITLYATPVEKWIGDHYRYEVGSAVKITNIKKAIRQIEKYVTKPQTMQPYVDACISQHRTDGPDVLADVIFQRLQVRNLINQ